MQRRWLVSSVAAVAVLGLGAWLLQGLLNEREARRSAEDRAANLSVQVTRQDERLEEATRKELDTARAVERLSADFQALRDYAQQETQRLRALNDDLLVEKTELLKRVNGLDVSLQEVRLERQVLASDLSRAEQSSEKARAQWAVEQAQAAAAQEALRGQAAQAQRTALETELELKRTQTKAVELEKNLLQTGAAADRARQANEQLNGALQQTQAERDTAAWQAAQAGAALNDAYRHIEDHHESDAQLRARLQRLGRDLNAAQAETAALRKQNQSLNATVTQLQQEIQRLREQLAGRPGVPPQSQPPRQQPVQNPPPPIGKRPMVRVASE